MESDNIKRPLYSFIELKQKAINIEKKSIDDYLFAFKYYDIDSEMNLNYLNLLKEKNGFDEKYIKEFLRLMYTLKYEDRIKLKNLLKIEIDNLKIKNFNLKDLNLLHNKTTKEIFIDILKLTLKNYTFLEFENSLHNENFIEKQDFKCPFYEGNDEFFFSGIINQFNFYLCELKNKPLNIINEYKESQSKCNLFKKFQDEILLDSNFASQSLAIKINNVKKKKYKEEKHNEEIIKEKIKENYNEEYETIFKKKVIFLHKYISKYISKEFQKHYKEIQYSNIEKIIKKRLNRIYPLFLLQMLISYTEFNLINQKLIKQLNDMFYEEESIKIESLNFQILKGIIDIYDDNKLIKKLTKLENKNYLLVIKSNNNKIIINFYDYIINNLFSSLICELEELNILLKDSNNWTLQKYAKENILFSQKELSDIVINNINETIQKNGILKEVFNEVKIFNDYIYPYDNEKIISQINNSILIFPFTCYSIDGLTLKEIGIILINNNNNNENEENIENEKYFYYFLMKSMLYKVIFIHEINFHYCFVLIHSNYNETILTPKKLFINYEIKDEENNLDCGEKVEILLFGKPISFLFINSALFISDDKQWILNDKNFEEFGNKFLKINSSHNDVPEFYSIINLNEFTKNLYSFILENYNKYDEIKKKKKEDLKNIYITAAHRQGKVELEYKLNPNAGIFIGNIRKCIPVNAMLKPIYPNLFKNFKDN